MSDLVTTRLSLHVVAELLVAGPQFEQSGNIKLRVSEGGFATVEAPDLRVEGVVLVNGERRVALEGRTVAQAAQEAGLEPRTLDDVYSGGCGLTAEHLLAVDAGCAAEIAEGFRRGDEALAVFAPEAERVLWPEHFDIGISVGEVNYGVSPGDSFLAEPYAYVGPWTPGEYAGPFWNTPFGSARPMRELDDVVAYFAEGARLVVG